MILGNCLTVKTNFINGIISKDEVIGLLDQDRISNLENTVIITISDPEFTEEERAPIEDHYLNRFNDSLSIKFYDTVDKYINDKGEEIYPISKELVYEMKEFILKNKAKKFIINCNAGISRSAGVGLLVEYILGGFDDLYHFKTSYQDVISDHYRYSPNLAILDCLR